ncbi:MAG: hypothetical protein WBK95_08265 [Sulfurimonas sp.]|nr:hypothetical protein [Sulfurimonas sp.]MDD3059405.1 hypothetical protein [Sulfurimonas sp.]MDD5203155.1 hypothetical protein [Sulfurimonas sp.]
MGVKKFIKSMKKFLKLGDSVAEGKKRSVKELLKQLVKRKRSLKKQLELELEKKQKRELKEELEIVSVEIKKGKAILYKLYAKKK